MIRNVRLIVCVLASAGLAARAAEAPEPAPTMAKAANAFLATLASAKRAKAELPFNSDARLDWHFVPRERQGLPIKQMSSEERQSALAFLKSSPSARGFTEVDRILHLEEVLFAIEGRVIRDSEPRMARVKADLPNVRFAWMGGLEKGQRHYYRVQGSAFLIEYDNTPGQRKPHPLRVGSGGPPFTAGRFVLPAF